MTKKIWLIVGLLIPVMLYAERDSIALEMTMADGGVLWLRKDTILLLDAKDDDLKFQASSRLAKEFSFRLEGFESVDNQTNRQIRYTNLHGGNYNLVVSAKDCATRRIEIKVKYTLFEEAWFEYSFLLYLSLLVLGVAYLWKIYDNRKKEQIARLKNKLVSDLHDDIGSSLTSIIIFTKLLQKSELPNDDAKEISNDILETAQESIEHLRDIVEVLRPTKDNFYDLIEKLKNHGNKILKAQGIAVEYSVFPEGNWQEKMKQKSINIKLNLNAYFIFKEVINNLLKHAQATQVSISVRKERDNIVVCVEDNGKGFDTSKQYNGFGMSTLRQRAAESHIDFDLQSSIGKGTSVKMKIPII